MEKQNGKNRQGREAKRSWRPFYVPGSTHRDVTNLVTSLVDVTQMSAYVVDILNISCLSFWDGVCLGDWLTTGVWASPIASSQVPKAALTGAINVGDGDRCYNTDRNIIYWI